MTLRNEDPGRALARLEIVKASLDATGEGEKFAYFVLSDTDNEDISTSEVRAVEDWKQRERAGARINYRRRFSNEGFKASNVREFCAAWVKDFELMLPLDADSLMRGPTILRLVRIMEAYPRIGILQSLITGLPAKSPFARLFQFGMRLGMRTYTLGQSWWTADCGPYWGHNAVVRIRPFLDHCALPVLAGKPPLGGHILSHDQVEAVLMRRAGFEVRVLPVECGSFEDNPPDSLEFTSRDVRWCQGNMQYVKLLNMPGLLPVGRFQLVWAILMFVGVPAWTMVMALLPLLAHQAKMTVDFPTGSAKALFLTVLTISLAPKLAGALDVLWRKGEAVRFGGRLMFAAGVVAEVIFSLLQGAISAIRTSIFMAGLIAGKSTTWKSQRRDGQGLSWGEAWTALWPQTVFGLAVLLPLSLISWQAFLWSLPLTAGYILAVPFAVFSASPKVGQAMRKAGFCGTPEDFAPPAEIETLHRQQTMSP